MALNAAEVKGKPREYELIDPGTYPTRLVAVVDLGLQAQRPFQGQDKPPAREISLTYEFTDVFMKDEDGKEDVTKPRWLTEILAFHNLSQEKAKSTIRYKALDTKMAFGGDWTKLIEIPCMVTVTQNPGKGKNVGKIYENVAGVSLMRPKDAEKAAELVNKPIVFDLDNPTQEVWVRLPKFLQDRIKGNLEFSGSALEKLIGKDATPPKENKVSKPKADEVQVEEDETPY